MSTTKKEIRRRYQNIIAIPDKPSYILIYDDRECFNSGVYGWNFDVYFINECNIAITSGYRGTFGNLDCDRDLIEQVNKQCKDIYYSKILSSEDKKQLITDIKINLFNDIKASNF